MRRRQGVDQHQVLLAVIDFIERQLLLVARRRLLVFSPKTLIENVELGVAPTWKGLRARDPDRHARLHGHRDDLEHGRGGPGRGQDGPGGDQPRAARRVRDLLHAAGRGADRAAGPRRRADGRVLHAARADRGGGRLRRRPDPRRRQAAWTSGRCRTSARSTSACSPPRSCSSPPTRASSASRGSSTRWASTARCPTRCGGCTRATGRHGSASSSSAALAILDHPARPGGLPRQPLLLRRAAVVHDRARLRHPPAARSSPTPAPLPRPGQPADRRLRRAAVRDRRRHVHGDRIRGHRRRSNPAVAAAGIGWLAFGELVYVALPAPPGARPRPPPTRSRSRSRSSTTRRSTTPCWCRSSTTATTTSVMATATKLAARKRRGIHVDRRSSPSRTRCRSTRRCARPRPTRESVIEQARMQGGRRVSGHIERIRAGQAGRRIVEEAMDMRAAAIVMRAAAAGRRRVAVRQDARDRAGRAAVPGRDRVAAGAERTRGAAARSSAQVAP